jgi:hypothetical protein
VLLAFAQPARLNTDEGCRDLLQSLPCLTVLLAFAQPARPSVSSFPASGPPSPSPPFDQRAEPARPRAVRGRTQRLQVRDNWWEYLTTHPIFASPSQPSLPSLASLPVLVMSRLCQGSSFKPLCGKHTLVLNEVSQIVLSSRCAASILRC